MSTVPAREKRSSDTARKNHWSGCLCCVFGRGGSEGGQVSVCSLKTKQVRSICSRDGRMIWWLEGVKALFFVCVEGGVVGPDVAGLVAWPGWLMSVWKREGLA
jgi:hypothetical protein